MIKIKLGKWSATYKDWGPWSSESETFQRTLNRLSSPSELDRISGGYYPNTENAIINNIKDFFGPGLEILEHIPPKVDPTPDGVKY